MTILGIGLQHDAGAAVISQGRILAAVNEERLNRQKLYWGWPELSVPHVLELAGVPPTDIDAVAVANTTNSTYSEGLESFQPTDLKRRMLIHLSRIGLAGLVGGTQVGIDLYRCLNSKRLRGISRRRFETWVRGCGVNAPIVYMDHHEAHLASAYYTSEWDDCLAISIDGVGDGYCSRIAICRDGQMDLVHSVPFYHTPGQYYGFVTGWAGFRPGRHEGKITGLAAHGDPDKVIEIFRNRISYSEKKFSFVNHGRWGWAEYEALSKDLDGHDRSDVAAGVQKHLEDLVAQYVVQAVNTYGLRKIALSGGIFANVKLNQRIRQLDCVDDVFVHPNMGDGGLALGSALTLASHRSRLAPARLDNVYLGAGVEEREIEEELSRVELPFSRHQNVESEIASLLAAGQVVARVNGPMEYGPRALGNRSILYQATDVTVNDWLNKKLRRTEFMPFAPVILAERAEDYYVDYPVSSYTAEFMTITYDVTDRCKREAPAVVHVDSTARPQVVSQESNPSVHRVLEEYEKLTGFPQVINTSFNMHEEPIVCTAKDAVRAFQTGHLDVLAIGDYIVRNPSADGRTLEAESPT